MANEYHQQNRKSWNQATQQHHTHRPDLIEKYQNGHNNLYAEDMALLKDAHGKTLVHLQCNDGQDTISVAKFCGATVTGVDISDYAIEFAQKLAAETNTEARFIRSDLFDWFEANTEQFEVVYTSYGALGWLSDIEQWGRGVAKPLVDGGEVVVVEFHPFVGMLGANYEFQYDYMGGNPDPTDGVGDYVGDDYEGAFANKEGAYEFSWSIGEVVSALLDAGLTLTHLREYPYSNGWKPMREMHSITDENGKTRHYSAEGDAQTADDVQHQSTKVTVGHVTIGTVD